MDEILTVSLTEAAKMLGVSRSTAYSLAAKNEFPLPIIRIGKQLKVSRQKLREFVDAA